MGIKFPNMMKEILKFKTYTMEYYSAIERNEVELFVVRWMDVESVIQSEVKSEGEKTNTV